MSLRHHVATLAQEHPELQPALTAALKMAGFNLGEQAHKMLWNLHGDYEAKTQAALDKLQTRLEKALLKIDFVLDRRTTYFERIDHHEGPRFSGTVAFVDKRDHSVRSTQQVRSDLEAVGIYLSNPKQDNRGVWTVNVGE